MYETSKAVQRRLHDPNFISRYFKGHGIDIGSGNDPLGAYIELFPLMNGCKSFDREHGDAAQIQGKEEFDFVHASHVLEDMMNPTNALERWFQLVKPGGHLIVTVPDEDMYEQGVWPSEFNADHKWTFTIAKSYSWSKHSINLIDIIHELGGEADLIKIEQLTGTYRFDLPRQDQTRTPIAEAGIEIIIRKRQKMEMAVGGYTHAILAEPALKEQPAELLPGARTYVSKPKIALHRPGAYGDIIMTLALIPLLKKKYPEHEVHYYCNKAIGNNLAGLMQAAGIDNLIDCNLGIVGEGYSKVFNLIGYPLNEGYPEKPMRKHLIEYFADEMGLEPFFELPHLTLSRPPKPQGLPAKYATIHPQAGWSVYKQWPLTRWQDVIAEHPTIPFYQIGGEDDVRLKGADHTCMGKTFYDSISLLANASLHLGVDTWTNHATNIEWEFKMDAVTFHQFIPAIILWGSTQWRAAGYMRNQNLSLGLPCQPCFREDPKISRMPRGPCINPPGQVYEKPMHACMDGITVDDVLEEIDRVWK